MRHDSVWVVVGLTLLAGCQPASERGPVAHDVEAAADTNDKTETDWFACYLQGDKTGHAEVSARRLRDGGRELVEITSLERIHARRFGNDIELAIETTSVETPDGQVVRFGSTTTTGANSDTISGRREGAELLLETTIAGNHSSSRMPCPTDVLGFKGVEQSLEREPLQPGQTRSLKVLLPMLSAITIAQIELVARDREETKLLDRTESLLRIDGSTTLAGNTPLVVRSSLWTDRQGRVLKSASNAAPGMEEINYRTTRDVALADAGKIRFDLGFDLIVKIDKPLPAPWLTKRVLYRVELDDKNPADAFPASATQQVTSKGPHTAEILLLAPDPAAKPPAAEREQPTPQDSIPSAMIQCDDPLIVEMARKARGTQTKPLAVALALEKYVHKTVSTTDFSQVFSSALEVARTKQGDCTENAVLLAALARASGLPARVVFGLVYVEREQGFGYHMWTEVFVDGRWLPLDATLGKGGIGASHLKLSDSNLADAGSGGEAVFASLLSVMQVIGRLKISVLEAK